MNVLKKLLVLCSLLYGSLVLADELGDILSSNKLEIFEYQHQDNELNSEKLLKSWINPVVLRYQKDYSTQFGDDTIKTGRFSVSINQPIFRSGGIYFGIKYAQVQRKANNAEIERQKRKLLGDAVSILFNLKKLSLQQNKSKLLIANDLISIRQKRESYQSGLLDSSFLDRAILQKSQNEASLLKMELNSLELEQRFSLLSDKNPKKLRLPKLKLMDKSSYKHKNLTLKRDKYRASQASYNEKVTWAKYMPTLSVSGSYIDADINPLFRQVGSGLKEQYYNYSMSVSMALDINALTDIEASRVAKLKSATQVIDTKMTIEKEYEWIKKSLFILDKNIELAKKDEKIYLNLYRLTKNLVSAGEKTSHDAKLMKNSLEVRKIDQKIYAIDKQIQLLKLYARMKNAL